MDDGETVTLTIDYAESRGKELSATSHNRATTVIRSLCLASAGERPADVVNAFPNLLFPFDVLTSLTQVPGDDSRWYVIRHSGLIHVFDNNPATDSAPVFMDLTGKFNRRLEEGVVGMAIHPNFAGNGEVFISYPENGAHTGTHAELVRVVAHFTSRDDGQILDPLSEEAVFRVNLDTTSHTGGGIRFGPDGYLYIVNGDSFPGLDAPYRRAQDTTNMLGAMLRIDPDRGSLYAIPPDNPFVGNPLCAADHSSIQPCPEIWAWGFRNPWGWSFDSETGELWVAGPGQGNYEEVNIVRRGGNCR